MQMNVMPSVDESLVGFNIEMLFEYPTVVKGGTYLDLAYGTVKEITNKNTNRVLIEWNDECLGRLDKK